MKIKIDEFNGNYASVKFFPETDDDNNTLSAFRNNRASDSIELTIIQLVQDAIRINSHGSLFST